MNDDAVIADNSSRTDQPGRRYKPEQTRQLILDAARELFRSKGYTQTSSFEIAQRAGVAEGSVFYHFGSKKNLLATLGTHYAQEKVVAMQRGETDLSRLEPGIVIARAFDHVRQHGLTVETTGLSMTSPEIQPFLNANRTVIVAFIARCITASQTGCNPHGIDAHAAELAASFSYAVVSDALHLVFESEHEHDFDVTLEQTICYVRAACGYGHLEGVPDIEPPNESARKMPLAPDESAPE